MGVKAGEVDKFRRVRSEELLNKTRKVDKLHNRQRTEIIVKEDIRGFAQGTRLRVEKR
jgi:hypothetical protein